MKKIVFSLAFAAFGWAAGAQSLDRQVTASAGKDLGTPAASMDYTFGEFVVASFSGTTAGFNPTTYSLTQGFHQGITTRQVARMATGALEEMDENALQLQSRADALAGHSLSVYPNPTAGALNIELTGAWEGTSRFVLTGINGQEIRSGQITALSQTLDLAGEKPGLYILRVMNPSAKLDRTFRVVKQ